MSAFWRWLARRLMVSSRVRLVLVPVAGMGVVCVHTTTIHICAHIVNT
jgi:hypothetical protein